LALRVLGFPLKKDPAKHYSAYFYVRTKALYKGRDDAFIRRAADRDYQAMVDFGRDMLPTLYLSCPDGTTVSATLRKFAHAGRRTAGPAPVTADSVIGRVYRDTTPGGNANHWKSTSRHRAFYVASPNCSRRLRSVPQGYGWPEFICCPIDEVDSPPRFGVGVYAAVKAAGVRTYATKNPAARDAAAYAPYLDIWCSQPYSIPFEQIIAQTRYEYWCYPNHNAGEIKDRLTMCKGGRMTYGFGFWRSGYTTLIPWNWCWTTARDPFDYLRGRQSGCGQRMDNDGEVIPAVYWSCFREGYDDAISTPQQAIIQRQDLDPPCQAAVRRRRTLQET
jgi:hypothetical protein